MNTPSPDQIIEQLLANVRQENLPAAKAIQYVDRVLSTFRRIGLVGQDEAYILRVLESIGESYEALSSLNKAEETFREALTVAKNQHNQKAEATLLWKIGRVLRKRNRWDESLLHVRESRQIRETIQDSPGLAWCWISEGINHFNQGLYPQAIEVYQRALEIGHQINDRRIISSATMNLGVLATIKGDFELALLHYQNSLSLYEQLNSLGPMSQTYHNLGMCYKARAHWPEALDMFEKSLAIALDRGDMIMSALNYIHKAEVYLVLHDLTLTTTYCAQAVDICREIDYPLGIAEAYRVLGSAFTQKGNLATALGLLTESLQLCQQYQDRLGQAETKRVLGKLYVARNDKEEARLWFENARNQFELLGATHDVTITRQLLENL